MSWKISPTPESGQQDRRLTVLLVGSSVLLAVGIHHHFFRSVSPAFPPPSLTSVMSRATTTTSQNYIYDSAMIHDESPLLRLDCLPYDVILHVVAHLDFIDVQSLQSVRITLLSRWELP